MVELLSGGEMIARALEDEGVEYIFGYPGGAVLHIYDALETAWAHKLLGVQPPVMTMAERLGAWSRISLMLNELNRSVGRGDAYPFVINELVAEKLEFIEAAIHRLRALN